MNQNRIKKVLITGASGFIGNTLMRHYQDLGTAVIGVDLQGNGHDIVEGDIAQPESIKHLLGECDVIVHTAALVSNAMQDCDMWRVNVLATRNLIAAAKKYNVRRFVQISSIVAYGNAAEGEIDEDYPVHADGGSYVLTKLASEHAVLAAQANGDIEVVIIRPGDVYGPGSRPWIIAPLEAIAKNQFMLPAKGAGFFRPVYIDDLIRGIVLAAANPLAAGEIFNLSCEGYITTKEYFAPLYHWLGKKGPMQVSTKTALRISAIASKVADWTGKLNEASPATVLQLSTKSWFSIDKAKRILDWAPEVSFEEGMKRSHAWAKEQGLVK
ncbi:3-beta hydroxysteroid dehydrogenase [Glaciecola punicea]|jgi:nucleoside-diphosphate-sugar epimerase|uniref:NAD-dependent epimerase/dehydratase family protein n=1 Tax=Glaciecola punicea TaxID=56804 RepID=UPI000872362B|nr:NAD(P)-dependent oxidoreductase [Glaciecola punicea]OFA31153.1 3-beta hydroxysteroid dehydrogenase [Glaciecola punicea]